MDGLYGWVDKWVDGRIGGWVGGWPDGWMDGWGDGLQWARVGVLVTVKEGCCFIFILDKIIYVSKM